MPGKVLENHTKALKIKTIIIIIIIILLFEKSLISSIFCRNTVDRDLNQNKTVVPLFGAANAAPNKGTTIHTHILVLISPIISV